MALETVVFQQDPFINYACKDLYNIWGLDHDHHAHDYHHHHHHHQDYEHDDNDEDDDDDDRNLEAFNEVMSFKTYDHDGTFSGGVGGGGWRRGKGSGTTNAVPASPSAAAAAVVAGSSSGPSSIVMSSNYGRRKRRRTNKSFKNKEEMENQRMTHIAVERNRRRQMNDYLAVLRSLMPPSYAQRGDQASIVGGAINFVKELEQLLQFLESHKQVMMMQQQQQRQQQHCCSDQTSKLLFTNLFAFPQYSTTRTITTTTAAAAAGLVKDDNNNNNNYNVVDASAGGMSKKPSRIADIEVTMAESHANIKLLTRRHPKQLLTLITGFHSLSLTVLHLNITTVQHMILFSFSVKVEDDCQLTSVNDIATAVHELVGMIQEDTISSTS